MKRSVVGVGFVVVALLASACGTRVHEQAVAAGNGGLGDPGATASGPAAGGSGGGATGPVTGTGASAGVVLPVNGFGTAENPCGPNTGAPNTATGLGITETEIHVATIADPGGPKPGLNKGMFDSMKAFAAWCNSFGGINGRKLIVSYKDAAILRYKDMVLESCQDSFALVGGLGTLDSTGAQDAVDCGLVNVPGAAVSAEQSGADRTFQPLPILPDSYVTGPGQWVKATYPSSITQASTLYSKFSITESQSNKLVEAYETMGYKFVLKQSANINEENWAPIVVALKNAGAKYMTLTSSFEEIVPLQKAFASQSYHPEVTELETNFYNLKYPQLAKENGADTTNTFVHVTTWPFEEPKGNPAMAQYLKLLEAAEPGAQPESLGVMAFSAGLMFATAAKAAGSNLTRDSLVAELKKIHAWDGGGIHGKSDPGAHIPSGCFIMMKVASDLDPPTFVRAYPLPDKDKAVYDKGKGLACPENSIVKLKGNYGTGAKEKGK